jgi:hypothetical protein
MEKQRVEFRNSKQIKSLADVALAIGFETNRGLNNLLSTDLDRLMYILV